MEEIKVFYGYATYQPVKYIVTTKIVAKGWWIFKRNVNQYFIESDYMRMGPFDSADEVAETLMLLRS